MAAILPFSPLSFNPLQPKFNTISSNYSPKSAPKVLNSPMFQSFSVHHCHGARFCVRFGSGRNGSGSVRVGAVHDSGSGGGGGGGDDSGGFGRLGGDGDGNDGGDGFGESGSSGVSIFSWYSNALEKHPVFTKSLTSAFLTLIGDLTCQLWIDRVARLDMKRTFIFTLLGFSLVGPTLHYWYLTLSRSVTLTGAGGALMRLSLDQFIFSPIFIGVFLSMLTIMEGRPSQVVPKLQQEWFSSVLANWQLWIPFQFLNFQFVPQRFQVLGANVVALVWNVILSFKAHKEVVLK